MNENQNMYVRIDCYVHVVPTTLFLDNAKSSAKMKSLVFV